MTMRFFRRGMLALVALAPAGSVAAVAAEPSPAEFYGSNAIAVIVGYPSGGGYDAYARLLSRHLGKHIAGSPNIIVSNMPGAGSLIAANFLYNKAPKDGSVIGMFAGGLTLDPLLGNSKARFDSRRLTWIGSMNGETSLCLARSDAPIKTAQDIFKQEFIIGTASSTGGTFAFPTSSNYLLQTKFKLVSGYPGTAGVMLAVDRGEVQGMCGISYSSVKTARPQWLDKNLVNIILQESTRRLPELPDVPTVMDLAKDEETRRVLELIYGWKLAVGRPFAGPPDIPPARVAVLRQGFDATLKDSDFLAEAEKLQIEIVPTTAAEIEQFITRAYETPKALIDRANLAQGRTGAE
jgi:tripartite-type tricarboxylate transporter receptor subunit TctC